MSVHVSGTLAIPFVHAVCLGFGLSGTRKFHATVESLDLFPAEDVSKPKSGEMEVKVV